MILLDEPICDPLCEGERPIVIIEMFSTKEQLKIELYPEAAPITVSYFLTLVKEGFYSGLSFHRIVPNFIFQGGCPLGTGDGETEYYLKGEFAANGMDNPIKHTLGTLSMARQDGYDTASCQFFIMMGDSPSLDGQYAAFGRVIEGIEVLQRLQQLPIDPATSRSYAPIFMGSVYLEK